MGLGKFEMPGSRRRAINLRVQPGLQLRLPIVLLTLSVAFAWLFAANTQKAYARLAKVAVEEPWLQELVAQQHHDFLVVSMAIGAAYILFVVLACLAHGHRMLGPLIPIRRQIEGMKNGDYSTRTHLRVGDPCIDIAEDLNELASILRDQEKPAQNA